MQYIKNPKKIHAMLIKYINKDKISVGRREEDKDRFSSKVSLMDNSDRLTEEYLDGYEGVKLEILNTTYDSMKIQI